MKTTDNEEHGRGSHQSEAFTLPLTETAAEPEGADVQEAQRPMTQAQTTTAEASPSGSPVVTLDHPLSYLDGKLAHVEMFYESIPATAPPVNWTDNADVRKTFPVRRQPGSSKETLGSRQVPKCILMDAQTDHDKLIVVNWWRGLTKKEQAMEWEAIRAIYRQPSLSNDLLPKDYLKTLRSALPARTLRTSSTATTLSGAMANPQQQQQDAGDSVETSFFNMGVPLTKWSFRSISNAQELAEKLLIPVEALYCVVFDNTKPGLECSVSGCPYPAVLRNRHMCVVHCRQWYPRKGYIRGNRGHLLLGPSHYTHCGVRNDAICVCTDELCSAIGYSDDMVRLPSREKTREQVYAALRIDVSNDPAKKELFIMRKIAYVAPWHFHPQHRKMSFDGSWRVIKFRKKDVFSDPNDFDVAVTDQKDNESHVPTSTKPKDGTGESQQVNQPQKPQWIGCPPPTYSLRKFLDEEVRGTPFGRGRFLPQDLSKSLPGWVEAYCDKEEGPLALRELQTKELQATRMEFCEYILEQEKTIDTLELENKRLKLELEEVKASKKKSLRLARKRKAQNGNKLGQSPSKKRCRAAASITLTSPRRTEQLDAETDEEEEYGTCGENADGADEMPNGFDYSVNGQNTANNNGYTQGHHDNPAYGDLRQMSNHYLEAHNNENSRHLQ
jgi:hypothetical protein